MKQTRELKFIIDLYILYIRLFITGTNRLSGCISDLASAFRETSSANLYDVAAPALSAACENDMPLCQRNNDIILRSLARVDTAVSQNVFVVRLDLV